MLFLCLIPKCFFVYIVPIAYLEMNSKFLKIKVLFTLFNNLAQFKKYFTTYTCKVCMYNT